MPRQSYTQGFSLLELIVVLAGLGILAGLAIPNVVKYLQFAQIDEAKTLLNTAASQCLQELRTGNPSWRDVQPEALKSLEQAKTPGKSTLPGDYQYLDGKKTCKEVQIYDPAGGATLFPTLRFRIDEAGRVYKDAQYFNDETKRDCESWGNCGGSESADYLIQCKADESACRSAYDTFLKTQQDGGPWQVGQWNGTCKWPRDPQASCASTRIWTFEGQALTSKEEYDSRWEARFGKECADAKRKAIAGFNPPGEGIVNLPNCKVYERYYNNTQLDCRTEQDCAVAHAAASEQQRQQRCLAAEGQWKTTGSNGKFSEPGCEAKWQCNKVVLTSQADYDASTCGAPPPKSCIPLANAPRACRANPWRMGCESFCK